MLLTVIIPCHNESKTIKNLISEVNNLPIRSHIIVVDNNSTDNTSEIAMRTGVQVEKEQIQGKGAAVRRGLATVPNGTTHVFMVDGDGTYSVREITKALQIMQDANHEMITGHRVPNEVLSNSLNLRNVLHRIGNSFFTKITNLLLNSESKDVLSGWRLMTWNFAKTFPSVHDGFEVELELNSHAKKLGVSTADISIEYGVRPSDSFSKLRTGSDGLKILKSVLKSFTNDRPRIAFDLLSAPWLLVSAYLLLRVLSSYFETGELKLPSLVFFTATFLVGIQLLTIGRILDRIAINQKSNLRIKFRED